MSAEFETLKYLVATLSNDPALVAAGVTVHTENHADIKNPVYPLITLELLDNPDDRLIQEPLVEMNVWVETPGVLKWEIADLVRSALIFKAGDTSGAWILDARKVCSIGNLDEPSIKKYRVLHRYAVKAVEKQ